MNDDNEIDFDAIAFEADMQAFLEAYEKAAGLDATIDMLREIREARGEQ